MVFTRWTNPQCCLWCGSFVALQVIRLDYLIVDYLTISRINQVNYQLCGSPMTNEPQRQR